MKFRMVDQILAWQTRSFIRGLKTVSFEEYDLKSAFGGEPQLPESLVAESLLQLGNWLIILSSSFTQMGLVVRTRAMTFSDVLRPGETLEMEVSVQSYRTDGITFDGRARAGHRLIAESTGCLAVPVPLDEYHDPEDLKVLFSEIHQPDKDKRNHATIG